MRLSTISCGYPQFSRSPVRAARQLGREHVERRSLASGRAGSGKFGRTDAIMQQALIS